MTFAAMEKGVNKMLIKLNPVSMQIVKTSLNNLERELLPKSINKIAIHYPISLFEDGIIITLTGEPKHLYSSLHELTMNYDIEIM